MRVAQRAELSGVAPHAGAWIETVGAPGMVLNLGSPLTRGRGLKHPAAELIEEPAESPLTRGRGLKLVIYAECRQQWVAPHAGAWIETCESLKRISDAGRRPSRGGVD